MRSVPKIMQLAHELVEQRQIDAPGQSTGFDTADGTAPKRRAGSGEDFWQFRSYQSGDSIRDIDWKRSARSQKVYIKQREETVSPRIGFWCASDAGFDWASLEDEGAYSKMDVALICQSAIALSLSKLGFQTRLFDDDQHLRRCASVENLVEKLSLPSTIPTLRQGLDFAFIASDFYSPISEWDEKFTQALGESCHVILLRVIDPTESEFPFTGHTEFTNPNTGEVLSFGRADAVKAAYLEAYTEQTNRLTNLASKNGWTLLRCDNRQPPKEVFLQAMDVIEQLLANAPQPQSGLQNAG